MTDIEKEIVNYLFSVSEEKYRDFNSSLIPEINKETVIGVRIPVLRKYASEIWASPETEKFLSVLPHKYYEENCLHGFLIENEKDYDRCVALLENFLPYIDNWAVCDTTNPKVLARDKARLIGLIRKWMSSEHTYTVRYGIGMLMRYFLDEDFREEYLDGVAEIVSSEYYIKMMQAWFFATALAKQYDAAVKYIERKKLDFQTHNMTIRKATESRRVSDEQKEYLRSLRVK